MKHALIVDTDSGACGRIEDALSNLGYRSFERAWTEDEAVAAAQRRRPDLVVVGEALDAGCPFSAARRICAARDIPALFAARRGGRRPTAPADAQISGPIPLGEAARALAEAQRAVPRLVAA